VELFNDPVKQKNLETILENQRKFLGESAREIVIPPSKRIGDRDVCKFCSNYVPIGNNLKKFGCAVWNYRLYAEDFSKDLSQKILSNAPVLLRVTGYPFYTVRHLAHTAITELVALADLSNIELSEILGLGVDPIERALRSPIDPRHRQLGEKYFQLLRDFIKSKQPI